MANTRGGGKTGGTVVPQRRERKRKADNHAQREPQSQPPPQQQSQLPQEPQFQLPPIEPLSHPARKPQFQLPRQPLFQMPPQSTDLPQWTPESWGIRVCEQPQSQVPPSDAAYFKKYAHSGVHLEMIKDSVCTKAFETAIMHHRSLIEGKVVMDVGCGTGILSILCARAGSKKVYAVDASAIAAQAEEIVNANSLADTVTVLRGRVEDLETGGEKVDVIISNWMGYMLLFEGMLESVIAARDRFLKPGGLILPSHAKLYLAPITHPGRYSESVGFLRNVREIDMSAMMPLAKQCEFEEPCVETISAANLLTRPHVVERVNCRTVRADELKRVSTSYSLQPTMRAPMHGIALWFEVGFSGPPTYATPIWSLSDDDCQSCKKIKSARVIEPPILSTAPEDAPTHWKQTVVYLDDPVDFDQNQVIEGSLILSKSKENPRFLEILHRLHLTDELDAEKKLVMKECPR